MKRQNTPQQKPRLFQLVRHTAVSGVRGTGTLADGVEWPDGAATLRWRAPWPVTSTWEDGLTALLTVHGQAGRTQVHWLPPPNSHPAPAARGSPPPAEIAPEQRGGLWLPAPGADDRCKQCGRGWPCLECTP